MKLFISITSIGVFALVIYFFVAHDGFIDVSPSPQIVYEVENNSSASPSSPAVYEAENDSPVSATILFAGDAMFDRYIRQIAEQKSYDHVLGGMSHLMQSSDCVIFNLEGPITTHDSISKYSEIGAPDNYTFTFDPVITSTLQKNNVCLTSIGNNHIGNFGVEGIRNTKDILESSGISYIGDVGVNSDKRYVIKTINDIEFAFVNYNAFTHDALEHTLEDMETVKKRAQFIIVYTHWGVEYSSQSSAQQKELAHTFIDHGASLVIGSHPHVVQEKEIYKGKTIYYSLGNFVFDQYFSAATKNGLMVEATFSSSDDEISFVENKITMKPDGTTNVEK